MTTPREPLHTPTHGPTAIADLDAGTITRTIEIEAPIDTVWSVLTDPDAIGRWWGHPASFPDGVVPGSLGTLELVGSGSFPIQIETVDRPRTFAFRWGHLGDPVPDEKASLVTFTIEGTHDGCRVTVVEEGFSSFVGDERREQMDGNVNGWNVVLDSLADYALAPA